KKKILASFLLGILLVFNVFAPVVNALDNLSTTTTTESVSESSVITSPELSIDVLDEKTNQFATGIQLTLIDSETKEAVETWQSSESDRKLSLIPERIYTLQVATDGTSYETIVDKDLKLAQDGQFYQKSESGDWQPVEGGLHVQLQSKVDSETTQVSEETSDTSNPKATATKASLETISLPKITAVHSDTKNIPATFRLVREEDSSQMSEWTSDSDIPKVELEVDKIYFIEIISIKSAFAPNGITKIRLNKDKELEYLSSGDWKKVGDSLEISVKSTSYTAFRAGQSSRLSPPQAVDPNVIAPINKLRIVSGIPGARVEYISGSNVREQFRVTTRNLQPNGGSPLYGGGAENNNFHIARYLDHNIQKTPGVYGHTVQFNGSNTNAFNYARDERAGWNANDLSLATTTMKASFHYTNAAYYEGRLVDAVATIKVTPMKNRTPGGAGYANPDYSTRNTWNQNGVNLPFYPAIQVGDSLFSGWAWQNVNEFNVDIQFFEKGSSTPINFKGGIYNDTEATYYTINSLNPAGSFDEQQYDPVHGPEYVLPQGGTYYAAYKYNRSNIEPLYTGDTANPNQFAYNGGINTWGGAQDTPTSPDFSMNSVLITTSDTNHLNFTLGNLSRSPLGSGRGGQDVRRTNYMWATISTDGFSGNEVKYKSIPVRKLWVGNQAATELTFELWATWKDNGVLNREFRQTQVARVSENWQFIFNEVPDEPSMLAIIKKQHPRRTITDFKYEVVEKDVPKGYAVTYDGVSTDTKGFTVTNTQTTAGLKITKKWFKQGIRLNNGSTSQLPNVRVNLKRKVGDQVDNSFDKEVTLMYNATETLSWNASVDDLPIKDNTGRNYTYYIEENLDNLPENYFLKGYDNAGITLDYDSNKNQLGISNDSYTTDLKIEKQWFKKDGMTRLRNGNLPKSLTVRIYQTTDGSTSNGKLYKTVTLNRSGAEGAYIWETRENLPLRSAKDGKQYYSYYIEEDKTQGYLEISETTQKQLINRSSSPFTQTNATMTLKNKVNPVYPSTGGFGNLPYISIGLLSLFMASIIYIMQKKKGI
ncbi:TPA: Cna B-type domain-containing protein, partial [Streptococcus suis]|nr:Cna B-type domain-containing protein [Streptococcus suis]